MIKLAERQSDLGMLPKTGTEAQKIRSLLLSYGTKYDFCRFYTAENYVLAILNSEIIISDFGMVDFDELAEFLEIRGFSGIFCSEYVGSVLSERLGIERETVNLMRFSGVPEKCGMEILQPREAYEIIKTGFDIEFESWYLDMSHRVRHGISQLYGFCGSALAVQYNLNGEALLSQIVTIPENRGRGCAARLIRAVCAELSECSVFVLCEDGLAPFYRKVGFTEVSRKCVLKRRVAIRGL